MADTQEKIILASFSYSDYKFLRQIVFAGLEMDGRLTIINGLPHLALGDSERQIWLFPEMERFLLLYMLTGNNTDIPKYFKPKRITNPSTTDNYIFKHIKREIERGKEKYTYKEETQDDINGIRFVGLYPYGSIDYGFFPPSWEELNTQLESVEPFEYADLEENDIPKLHYSALPTEDRDLAEGEYLDSLFPDGFIPTNTIIDKTICGCGATWLEIHSKRNSIIIEPNVPVIIGKEQQHSDKNIIGVYGEEIEVRDIMESIAEQTGYIKIMTTPDSYPKALQALYYLGYTCADEFFMLFDECEKMVSEIDFRPNLALPIDDFFKFKGKAMVSATPIVMSDPRFEQQGFKIIKIKPQGDHKQLLELKPTNNVNIAIKRAYEKIGKKKPICFFYNSIEGAEDIIALLGISDKTNIYCSAEAKKKLSRRKYKNVFDSVTDEDGINTLNIYNFFTSRFYSAVDIELDYQPIVIMVSDVHKKLPEKTVIDYQTGNKKTLYKTPYTLIDPETEAIQIAGRFRNGIERLIHITNTSPAIGYYSQENLEQNLKEQHKGLHLLNDLYESEKDYGVKEIIYNAIHSTEYWRGGYAYKETGEINYFRHNNAFLDERLKMLYNFPASLYKAYKRSGAFNVASESEYVIYTDEEKQKLENASLKVKAKLLNEILTRDIDSENPQDLEEIKKENSLLVESLSTLGYARMKELRFRKSAIETELKRIQNNTKIQSDNIKEEIYKAFNENTTYTVREVKDGLKKIYDNHNLQLDRQPQGKDIFNYFDGEEDRGTGGKRVCKLKSKLY